MEELRHTDAKVYAATHPGVRARGHANRCNPRLRWKLCRWNPMNKFRLAKYKARHPVEFQRTRARSRFDYVNPLTYIRRIQHNLTHAGRRHHSTTY
ncbi:uncharacterized protein [Physcomitrium patens]|uniref:Uncharacterized protein n=1 Tax=Physcomitrium patens TaxID=3218 RepID=A0A2K1KQ55_PHYPA|nr:hypothetical protein PHYPA_006797 [Physcomitrium patens]